MAANTRTDILEEAKQLINGPREDDYGSPKENFRQIADLWEAYIGVAFEAHDVAVMVALVKVARLSTSPDHRDSWVDMAGYAALGGEVAE